MIKIVIVGYGNLGKIYAQAFLQQGIVNAANLFIACKTPAKKQELEQTHTGTFFTAGESMAAEADIVLVAVKPQDYFSAAAHIKKLLSPHTLVLSVMAGITIHTLQQSLGHTLIMRAMPNSPIQIGRGITGYTGAQGLSAAQLQKGEQLLTATGLTHYVPREELLDAVTALSGSGPAYVFYILQCMIAAGQHMGFTEAEATKLVVQTMRGSVEMYAQSGKTAAELIKSVASKGGTTEAAFSVFNKNKLGDILSKGILAAAQRAKELQLSPRGEKK